MDELWISALKGLIAAGPATALLAYACTKLWAKLEEKDKIIREDRAEVIGLLRDAGRVDRDGDGKPG